MKKSDVINLIKYHYAKQELSFKRQAIDIANEFNNRGDSQVAQYIMGLISQNNVFIPQGEEFGTYLTPVVKNDMPLFLPQIIMEDITGIVNAINHNIGINKFLFVGAPGTGKTESVKQLSKLINRDILMVDFSELVDSKLGQTNKNLSELFGEINELPNPGEYIILFDEIDAIVMNRVNQNDLREMGRVTSNFLKHLDKINSELVIIGTTNLFEYFDKALIRRFDAVIDFDRYNENDKKTIFEEILKLNLKSFPDVTRDIRLFKKIIDIPNKLPNPGEIKNIVRTSLAFSDPKNPNDYLKRLLKTLNNGKEYDIQQLSDRGFTVREIEILTGISKSSVSRILKGE